MGRWSGKWAQRTTCNQVGITQSFSCVLINNQADVESIVDPGLQIITMSEYVCNDLSLVYDPSVMLNMQSTNREVDQLLGLVCNVPMTIGKITLYVQIHVIQRPAYDILLS